MGRRWTVEQADAALPAITSMVTSVRECIRRDSFRDGATGGDPRLVLHGVVDLLAVDGVVLRDVRQGLIDFPATTADGRDYWLCWVVGEASVEWWHWPEDGFAGRRPLGERPA